VIANAIVMRMPFIDWPFQCIVPVVLQLKGVGLLTHERLAPGITRRPKPLREDEEQRLAGRVHAVVGRNFGYT
jgi:membrane protein implicated in regulation of membrane protease activity